MKARGRRAREMCTEKPGLSRWILNMGERGKDEFVCILCVCYVRVT